MFPLQTSDDLVFQILSDPCQQDLSIDYASLGTSTHVLNNVNATSKIKKLPRRVLGTKITSNKNGDHIISASTTADEFKLKRIMHRDMERQRRQEMATLYSSLRSLIPHQHIKGKRSVSDHMHEAVNYIKQMQANINDLERRREKLKMVPNNTTTSPSSSKKENGSSDSSSVSPADCVTVSPCHGGLEILIKGNYKGENVPLSRVLKELLKQGLDVVSCVSAKVNQVSLHRIQSQAGDMKCINLHALQREVIDVINIDL